MRTGSLFGPVSALLVSVLTCFLLGHYRGKWAVLDIPGKRSLHKIAVPRSGGLGIIAGVLAGLLLGNVKHIPGAGYVFIALFLVASVSLADDVYRLTPLTRLLAHAAAASILAFPASYGLVALTLPGVIWHAPGWLLYTLSTLFVVWMVNLYNFMDGMDGFAGGMAVIGFGTLALLGALAGSSDYCFVALTVCMASAGFLPFNFPPARLFMGDVGSGSLGLLAALLLLWGDRARLFPLWIGVLVFSPFIVDATWTVVRRILQGQKPWDAHREHFYQRLVRLGWGHKRTVLYSYALMLNYCLLALGCFWFTAPGVRETLLGLATLIYLALIASINAVERRSASL